MAKLKITDNALGLSLSDCLGDSQWNESIHKQTINDLSLIGGTELKDLVNENPDILVFPALLGAHQDGVESLRVCSYDERNDRLYTGNLMGFVGVNDTQISIRSRFAKVGDEDYFLHYMLMKVFCPNIFKLKHETSNDTVFDFLLYLFPHLLNEAMKQGLFKTYQNFRRNDSKVNGTIDVSRHIRMNIPFRGTIAYNTRGLAFDNPITQLIRHTVEFLKTSPLGRAMLTGPEIQENIRIIVDNTNSYCFRDRNKIIASNLKHVRHPYFTKYTVLQKLCLSILRHERLKYGSNKDKVYGILFDGAWLWEEYLNTLFKPLHIIHGENKTGKNPIYLFNGDKFVRYPDFFIKDKIVIDAKYKHLYSKEIARDDLHQVITYLHILNAQGAFLAYPTKRNKNTFETIGELNGLGGKIGLIGLKIPQDKSGMNNFKDSIRKEEDNLIETLKQEEYF